MFNRVSNCGVFLKIISANLACVLGKMNCITELKSMHTASRTLCSVQTVGHICPVSLVIADLADSMCTQSISFFKSTGDLFQCICLTLLMFFKISGTIGVL